MERGSEREELFRRCGIVVQHDCYPSDEFMTGKFRERVPRLEQCPLGTLNPCSHRQQEGLSVNPGLLLTVQDTSADQLLPHLFTPNQGYSHHPLLLLHLSSVTLMYTGNAHLYLWKIISRGLKGGR
ncbi:MAG: hypothetical protein BWY93_01710 [Euryarchaeota archaeon ADurb.BinA087]|nr:MAG: hypothetical protein BWY93_01710 [Euryarchaeota archaeon ADurb.BinA087]